jgi:hypothetical protein
VTFRGRVAAIVVAAALVVTIGAGCGDDDASPGSADSCEELVDGAAVVAAQVVADLAGKSATDLDPGTAEDPYPELTRPFAAYEARAEELGCDRGELRRLACEAYQGIEPSGGAGEEFLAQLIEVCR